MDIANDEFEMLSETLKNFGNEFVSDPDARRVPLPGQPLPIADAAKQVEDDTAPCEALFFWGVYFCMSSMS